MATIISSQDYINEDIVAEKIANKDFDVFLSPVFEIDGEEYQVMMDGHHSYQAAIESGNEPIFIIQSAQDNDRVLLIDNPEWFLQNCYMDTDWYNVETGIGVW